MLESFKIKSLLFFSIYLTAFTLYFLNSKAEDKMPTAPAEEVDSATEDPTKYFIDLLNENNALTVDRAVNYIEGNWNDSYEIMLLESIYFARSIDHSRKLMTILQRKTGKKFGFDYDKWFQWIWNRNPNYTKEYYAFKAQLHQLIDPKFNRYFENRAEQSTIRLDEVRWGGVLQDGIPPLRGPEMISAEEAKYVRDGATVFGIEVNGDARAYPKQVLAWHEMFVDTVGDVPLAGVYCTLCGTVILYKTEHEGVNHELGTSGFLYRSNKLMYDKKTQSLWSTLEGEPVIGPLVGKGIKLDYLSVVTTTWGEWKKRHPDTSVLSLATGHRRDYGEGVAYKDYFATDDLMFTIPEVDRSLRNKDEILALRLPNNSKANMAISSKFLKRNPIYQNTIGTTVFTVFTDKTGAHRVFKTKGKTFNKYDRGSKAIDADGNEWLVLENELKGPNGQVLERFQSHNAFWFGYKAAFPEVELIK